MAYLYDSGRLSGINTATTAYTITYDTFGNMVSVSAGGNVLATYTYAAGNGKLTRMTYGNGEYEEYTYDNLDRLVKVSYNGNSVNDYIIVYDSNGRLAKAVDGKAGITYLYEYDSLDRLIRAYQKDANGNTIFAVENSYDEYGRAKGSKIKIGNKTLSYSISYKTNTNLVSGISMPESGVMSAINYTYDNFDRLTVKNSSLSTLADIYEKYEYYTYTKGGKIYTTPLVSKLTFENKRGSTDVEPAEVYEYTYNALGYITNIKKNGTTISTYSYDALGQLVGETVNNQIYIYSYDKSGNITQKRVFTGDIGNLTDTINYTYSTSAWGDLLTNYDGTAITYDSIGNPTKWRNSSSLTWNGRTLTSQTLTNGNSITYKYNSEGIRTQKRVFDDVASAYITHDYVLDGSKILSETVTDNAYYNSYTLYYVYDANGSITGLHYNGTPYYFQKNIQGDILRICNASGAVVVEYTYDAWGNILSVTGSMASTLGQYNPFRYRGYYYDNETEWYYLNSRYYDAKVGRFINADSIVGANGGILGYNMFAYCSNNPVISFDPAGTNEESFFDKLLNGALDWYTDNRDELPTPAVEFCDFVADLTEDFLNYDENNTDVDKVYDSNYFSSYKGAFVLRHSSDFLTSWNINETIFLNHNLDGKSLAYKTKTLNHEYGHYLQEQEFGTADYIMYIGLPSITYNLFARKSEVLAKNYYNMPWEYDADVRGNVSRNHALWAKPAAKIYFLCVED